MSGPGDTPFNTQASQGSQEPSKATQGPQGVPGSTNAAGLPMNLVTALGGNDNLVSLMQVIGHMNKTCMAEILGGISKMIDDKLAAAVPISQQSVAGVSQAPAPDVTAVGTSQGDEVNYRLSPRLQIDEETKEISGTDSMNEFNAVARNVYERNLKPWEKSADQTIERKCRMVLEMRQHFRNGHMLNDSTIKTKLGSIGRNSRDYLHGIIKDFDDGVCDRQKLRKAMFEETEGKIRDLENTKVNQIAVSSQQKKKVYKHQKKTGRKARPQDIEKAKNEGIEAVFAEWDFLADQEDSPFEEEENANEDKESGDEEGDGEDDDQDEQENEEEQEEQDEDDDLPRPTENARGRPGSSQGAGSSKGKKKRNVPDSQFAQDPYHSSEEEEPPRKQTKKKVANDTRRSARTMYTRTKKAAKSPIIRKTYKKRPTGR
ncbi:hypothetical protein R1sor_009532 [Riccia sorocarpa]|uniref:Uncharacterized protein n=1 Tax=Riccia sorocarpa TaxID=122646 RepID=A0ABD3HZH6_9MARC